MSDLVDRVVNVFPQEQCTVAGATDRAATAISTAEQDAAAILERARAEAEALLSRARVEAEEMIASVRRQAEAIEPPSVRDLWARVWDGTAPPEAEQEPVEPGTNGWRGQDALDLDDRTVSDIVP